VYHDAGYLTYGIGNISVSKNDQQAAGKLPNRKTTNEVAILILDLAL
jgi:hypothetical protein